VANILWLAAYLVLLAIVVHGLRVFRSSALSAYATSQAAQDWQQWREAAMELGKTGPVARATPKSLEPPALVLMRDHYAACLGISLLLTSVLYFTFMIAIRGALRRTDIPVRPR
jgi:hypothetical protein